MAGYTKQAAVLLATLMVGAVFAAPEAAAAQSTPSSTTDAETAVVRVTIEQADGTKLRSTKVVHWGAVAEFDLGGHDLDVAVTDKRHLSVSYSRDGSKLADKTMDAAPRKSLVVHDDAGSKVTVKVIPTRVHIETTQL